MSEEVDLKKPLMPRATAVWMIDNTALTFEQIAEFTGLHKVEVQALADDEVGRGIIGRNPVEHGELTQEELDRCQADDTIMPRMAKSDLPPPRVRSKGPKYTPVSKRGDKPDAIAYLLKNHPELSDAQICKLVGTTKPTIKSVRDRTHSNMQNIKARNPADLGLCTYKELEEVSHKALRAQGKDPEEIARQKQAEEEQKRQAEEDERQEDDSRAGRLAGFDFSNFMKTGTSSGDNQ